MYEFHGWCSLRGSPAGRDDDTQRARGLELVKSFVDTLDWSNGFCALSLYDGEYFIHLGGFHNRPRGTASDLKHLLELVARVLPDSYGLVYWKDDEDPAPPGFNNWHVRVLACGSVQERFDPFLSPTTPVTED